MKRILCLIFSLLLIAAMGFALAEATETPAAAGEVAVLIEDAQSADASGVNVGEPLTWTYLATIAGAAAFTLLIVQFFKAPLDRIWKVPTRVFAYVIALAIMLVATAFTTGLTLDSALLVVANAFIAAMSAYGAYEITFAKVGK